jgi:general secretion pathway protein C
MTVYQESGQMVTMAKGGLSLLLFNLRKMLNHRITVLCITALLAFYVLWQTGSLVWKLWLLDNESPQAAALVPSTPQSTEPESLQNILRYPLIRSASIATTSDSASSDQPKTSLNLKLVGLMYSPDKNQARAIIENQTDGARSYSTHERVADKAEIYSIEPDRVILLHAGRQEALMLDPEDDASSDRSGTDNQPTDDPRRNRASTESPSASGQIAASTPKKIADVMRDFSATPVMEKGQLVGFRLEALRNPELMNEWGIDPDDVITAVNGMPLNSQGRIMVLFDKLKKQKEFELTLINGGNSRTITVDLYE